MKDLYEHLIKQHIKNNNQVLFELYCLNDTDDRCFILIDNKEKLNEFKQCECAKNSKVDAGWVAVVDNLFGRPGHNTLFVRPDKHWGWTMFNASCDDVDIDYFKNTNKRISISDFTVSFWGKNKFYTGE